MGKTLDSVRNKKFVDDTLKRALAAHAPLPFFCVLKHQDDKKPVLLLGNPDAELKKVALLPTAQVIKGRCKKGKDAVEFYTDDANDEDKFKEALKKVAKDAGLTTPFAVVLKPASALGDEGTTATDEKKTLDELITKDKDDDQGDSSSLTFTKDSWLKFSETSSKRSAELKAIDNAFDALAKATDTQSQMDATAGLAANIQTWLTKKQGNSKRLAMVSSLREQVLAQLAGLQMKYLTKMANDFKTDFAELGQDIEVEIEALRQISNDVNKIKTADGVDANVFKLASALIGAATKKISEAVNKEKEKKFEGDRQPVMDSPILSKATKQMIASLEIDGGPLDSKAIVDALFDDFCAYGRAHWKYNTTSSTDANLLKGASTGACGTFATQFSNLVNIVVKKKIAKVAEASAKFFITVPLQSISFIDPACPGNLKMSPDAQPDRYFFSEHHITQTTVGKYCPTTGTKDAAVDGVVAKKGFAKAKVDDKEAYKLGDEVITWEVNKAYGNGSLYTLQAAK